MLKVWVNGTFDVLHIGHIRLLEFASKFGQLRVGIDSDERVRSLKGEDRPINGVNDRKEFLLSIKNVDDVVIFSSDDELINEIRTYNPDIIVVGGDYKGKTVIGSEFGGKVLYFDRIEGYSTTKILNYEGSSHR